MNVKMDEIILGKTMNTKRERAKKQWLYHVTSGLDTWISIRQTGLNCSVDGYIYLFNKKEVASSIAFNQLGLETYGLLKIDPNGLTGKQEPDNVGEFKAKFQVMVKQVKIEPRYIKPVSMVTIEFFDNSYTL